MTGDDKALEAFLRKAVIGASIFPVVPCANTNFPTLMAAEKIADGMV